VKATDIVKIQDAIDRLNEQIERLEAIVKEKKVEHDFLYIRLANLSPRYTKNIREIELVNHPNFPKLLARLLIQSGES
jgi:CCR4-NOT transcriptional regulation complex NOT5 subunit